MAAEEKWYFTKEQLAITPSRKCGYDADKELSNRQQAANFIQDMGQRLQVTQLCINTAIVYMHRFYVYHSFSQFHRNAIATAALFLAAKVEEQPRKLEHVIKVGHVCLHREPPPLDTKSENYLEQAQELVFNENVLLQTLGFDVAIDHPHTHVVRCCHMVKASKDLAQTSYFMASNSLHLTTMCLQYKPTVVACFCIHLACKWSNWEIPVSNEGKDWFYYVDKSVTFEQLETLTTEFLQIFDKCPTKLKRKIMSITATQSPMLPAHSAQPSQLFDNEPRKVVQDPHHRHPLLPSPSPSLDDVHRRPSSSAAAATTPHAPSKVVNLDVYRRKEKERIEREVKHGQAVGQVRESHHHTTGAHPAKPPPPGTKYPSTPSVPGVRPPPPGVPPHQRDALKTPQNPPRDYPSRLGVSASRDLARREQAHARELTKQREPQQTSIFAPPTKHETLPNPLTDSQVDVSSNHLNSSTSVNKNSSQEWQETLNHNNELESNRHHSDKYNLVNKDSRHVDPKRLHTKDQRLPVPKDGQKISSEDSQRMFNKYNHRKGEDGKEHERIDLTKRPPDSDHSLKRPSFGPTVPPPVPHQLSNSKRNEFNAKREELIRPANGSKPLVPGSHHGNMSKSQHRVPSPVVSGSNSRVSQPTVHPQHTSTPQISNRILTPGSTQHRAPLQNSGSQHRSSSPFVPHPQRPKSPKAINPKLLENVEMKPHKSVHTTPTKVDPRNGHPIERREVNHRQDSGKQEPLAYRADPVTVKQEPGIHRQDLVKHEPVTVVSRLDINSLKQEPLSHKQDSLKQEPVAFRADSVKQEVPRVDLVKQEPIERRPDSVKQELVQKSQADAGRVLADILRAAELPKPDVQRLPETLVKTESDVLSASSSQSTPKSSVNSSRSTSKSSVLGSNANSSTSNNRDTSHAQRPSKPSTRHQVPPPAPRKSYPQPEITSIAPTSSPEFGSPPPPIPTTPGKNVPLTPGYSSRSHNRNRTSSSSSEPELVPYVKKLEEIAGYENILDSKKGIKLDKLPLPGRVPDIIQPFRDRIKDEPHSGPSSRTNINSVSKELKPPDLIRPFPTQVPETPSHSNSVDVGAIAFPAMDSDPANVFIKSDSSLPNIIDVVNINETESIKTIIEPSKLVSMPLGLVLESSVKTEHSHKSEKKKKKEKHKHKDKDKNKDREERKHKRKHKDRDKEKHREKEKELLQSTLQISAPIKITIPKEKILGTIEGNPPQGLKIKIQKDRLKGPEVTATSTSSSPQSMPSGDLKLKIHRNQIEPYSVPAPKESRKRERTASKTVVEEPKPAKSARVDARKPTQNLAKHNGIRGQHHKVSSSQPTVSTETGRGSKGGNATSHSQPL